MTHQGEQIAYIGLGSNLGDRLAVITAASERLAILGTVKAISPIYQSIPWQMSPDSPHFLNLAAAVVTAASPEHLLRQLEAIEQSLGRTDKGKNLSRVIDLDLLLYGDLIVQSERLHVPHPRITERGFVLLPLVDLNQSLRHPATSRLLSDYITPQMRIDTTMLSDQRRADVRS